MHSRKNRDTIVIISTDSGEEMAKILTDNAKNWAEIKKPELDELLEAFPQPNRAERRRNIITSDKRLKLYEGHRWAGKLEYYKACKAK